MPKTTIINNLSAQEAYDRVIYLNAGRNNKPFKTEKYDSKSWCKKTKMEISYIYRY